ncbi:MAG: (2Fe-2S)-binding protein [Bdellovibrionales bacterium]|nr:(2Fe-2S)-binding protein [Bdellovibrionales bacterium]
MSIKVKFLPSNKEVTADKGEVLLDIALNHGIDIQHACGGFCACTTCHCEVIEGMTNLEDPEGDELERLDVMDGRTEKSRLACQSKIKGPVTVRVVNQD